MAEQLNIQGNEVQIPSVDLVVSMFAKYLFPAPVPRVHAIQVRDSQWGAIIDLDYADMKDYLTLAGSTDNNPSRRFVDFEILYEISTRLNNVWQPPRVHSENPRLVWRPITANRQLDIRVRKVVSLTDEITYRSPWSYPLSVRAGFGIPAAPVITENTPSSFVLIGGTVWGASQYEYRLRPVRTPEAAWQDVQTFPKVDSTTQLNGVTLFQGQPRLRFRVLAEQGTQYEVQTRGVFPTSSTQERRSDWSESTNTYLIIAPPFPPSISVESPSSFIASWITIGADRYEYQIREARQVWPEEVVQTTTPRATITGLNPDTSYSFRVRSILDRGDDPYRTPWSAVATLQTPAIWDTPPPAPTASTSAVSSDSLTLSWSPVENAQSYEYRRKTGSMAYEAPVEVSGTSFNITGLSSSTTYGFQVRGVQGDQTTDWSTEITVTTLAPPAMLSAPAAPTTSLVRNTRLTLSWRAVTGAASYQVRRRTGTGAWGSPVAATGTSAAITGLTRNTAYGFQVRAIRGSEMSPWSPETTVTTTNITSFTAATVPAPTISRVQSTSLTLSWPEIQGATSYAIQERIGSGAWTSVISVNAILRSWRITGLRSNTAYGFRYRGVRTSGIPLQTAWSAEATATTMASSSPLAAPAAPAVSAVTSSGLTLSWSGVSGATGYDYRRRTGTGAWGVPVAVPSGTSVSVTGLSASTGYGFQVRAKDATRTSGWSAETTATTSAVSGPPGLTFNVVSGSRDSSSVQVFYRITTLSGSFPQTLFLRLRRQGTTTWFTSSGQHMAGVPVFAQVRVTVTSPTAGMYEVQVATAGGGSASSPSTGWSASQTVNIS